MAIETTQIYKNLYNSEICRLCGEQNSNGTPLYEDAYDEVDIITLINIYLPVKISDDGKYPKRICPGCHLQVESTAQFFDLLLLGQEKLRSLLRHEVDEQKKYQKSQSLLKIDCKEPKELPNNNDYMIIEEKPLFGVDHKLSMKCEGIEKPRRKRGRPPRPPPEELEAQRLEQIALLEEKIKIKQEAESDIEDENGQRKKRRIKIPSRFQEVVQGKELEKILAEEGVIDKLEFSDAEDTTEDGSRKLGGDFRNEIIGHLQGNDGINIGDLVFIKSPKRGRKNYNRKGRTKLLCDICNKEFFHEYRFMKHRASHSNARFECTECLTEFSERKHLTDHQQITNHKGEGVIESMDLTQEPYKVRHYTPNNDDENCSDEGETPYAAATMAIDELNDSLISEKENQPMLPESTKSELNEEFIKLGDGLDQSLVDIVQTKLQCDICLREFNHQGSLMYHKESQHNKNRKFICSKCGKSFSHRLLLQRHQKAHSNDRPFECNFCHAKFKSKSNLKNHRLKHSGDKNYPCNVCQQKFTHRNSLITHMRLHSGEKPYKCNVCDKKFTQNGNLNEHMRTHTGERPFKCTHCERTFTTSSQCKSHIKKHIGERPFVCEICDKRFLYLEIYKTHLRRHNGEKPFSCSICKKGFADNWGLRKHQRFHTGEKPYPCEFCGKHFADCSNLKKHKANNCTLRFTIKPIENTELSYTNELPEEESNHCEQEISITQPTTDHIEEIIRNSSSPPPLALATYNDPRNNPEIIQCKPIIYLTYQSTMTNEINQTCNHNPINSITEIDPITGNELALVNSNDTITTHQYFNDTILNHITDDGSCHDPMIITMTKDDSDENVDCITTENILQLAHNGSDLLYQIQTNDGLVENYGDSQQIEYITVEGRRLRLVNYADPIDLESPFIIS